MNKPITVSAAILIKNNLILAARRRSGLHLAGFWEFPGGKLENGEDPKTCLHRELLEEFGIETEIGPCIGESVYAYPEKTIRLLGFITYHTGGKFVLTDHDKINWISHENLNQLTWAPADIPLIDAFMKYIAGQ